ncbi:hypothetical protein RHMOL_Rhmol04G0307700 [Rhododendron molle]|uniref:Uncharacterized protein n=1 Tax=Rhododendron molle TaxID=49168 RepID=A0ACC0P7Q6_RHOML|nr:hypothetical protein RHMOL_Rhmol04G0307700 [Rhododendron molle]
METAVEIANKVGVADIIGRIVDNLKDDSEPYKRMVMESIEKVVANLGASDIDARLEELLIDGILYALLSHYPLTNKDLIDRQTVASTVKHMILGLAGFGCENALIYWLNYVWPNILGHPHTLVDAYPVLEDEKSCEVFPHLSSLVEIIEHGLNDENQKVRTTTALSLAALAEAAAPYGIESFDSVFKPFWKSYQIPPRKSLGCIA